MADVGFRVIGIGRPKPPCLFLLPQFEYEAMVEYMEHIGLPVMCSCDKCYRMSHRLKARTVSAIRNGREPIR